MRIIQKPHQDTTAKRQQPAVPRVPFRVITRDMGKLRADIDLNKFGALINSVDGPLAR
ncbi:MAG: hypothetical protein QM696_00085 [Steroidobacteraceae bacterium]